MTTLTILVTGGSSASGIAVARALGAASQGAHRGFGRCPDQSGRG